MKIILQKDFKGLGNKYDKINVKPGYARNYLIPNKYAIIATKNSIKQLNEILKQKYIKKEFFIKNSKLIIKKVSKLDIKIKAKVGYNGKLYGSVNNQDIVDFLLKENIKINKKFIRIDNIIKTVGNYKFCLFFNSEINHIFNFEVIS